MDFLDFFENMGFGLTIVISIIVILVLIMFIGRFIPLLLMGIGGILYTIMVICIIGAVVYFIGKFAKEFIKK
ncbi:hypothetical protein [uncultured Methanobrevibacter sp.]|uniref:hypothetical protein n=1 Tax=uncultured Methanobrevibacter sp. TaxID=253161 RepID=UPI00260C9751|nr:hypothetical protein [uncultured Methanobrevibacter sp.]